MSSMNLMTQQAAMKGFQMIKTQRGAELVDGRAQHQLVSRSMQTMLELPPAVSHDDWALMLCSAVYEFGSSLGLNHLKSFHCGLLCHEVHRAHYRSERDACVHDTAGRNQKKEPIAEAVMQYWITVFGTVLYTSPSILALFASTVQAHALYSGRNK